MDAVLAVDIGATKFAAALVDDQGEVITRRQTRADRESGTDGLFEQLAGLVEAVMAEAPGFGVAIVGCGVGAAGPITPNLELISPVNLKEWRDFPLRSRLAEATGLVVAGDLDTKALALGEGWVGGAVGVRNFMSMVVSTGIGGGIVLDGRLLEGESANAGHIGHVIVVPGGRQCGCGAYGCLEAEASGSAIEATTGRPPADANSAVVERTGRLVGRAVASVVNLLGFELTLVSGSVALGFGQPFFESAQAEMDANCRLAGPRPVIRPAGLGDQAPLIGAAAVGWQALGRLDPLGG